MRRREFLNVIGVTGAVAALSGCSRGGGPLKVLPYLRPANDGVQPGVDVEYATVCRECPAGCGIIAITRDGRCHKVEGNPDHPINRGKLCIRGQASLQGLYNPDRNPQPLIRDSHGRLVHTSWEAGMRRLHSALGSASAAGGRVAWIGRLETGPFDRLVDDWLAAVAPGHTRLRYELYAYEPLREASRRVFGAAEVPQFRLDRATTILSFGADFIETWVSNVEYTREFSRWRQRRLAGEHHGRYIFISSRLSLTGQSADEWIQIRPGSEGAVAEALAWLVGPHTGVMDLDGRAAQAGIRRETIERLAREIAATSPSLVLPPSNMENRERSADIHEAILQLNDFLGNIGQTVFPGWPHALSRASTYREMQDLIAAMNSGAISLLFLHNVDPVYELPAASGIAEALAKVPQIISFSSQPDDTTGAVAETGGYAHLVLPDDTFLESWGEYSPRPGITGVLQPVAVRPFDTLATGDVLLQSAAALGHPLGSPTFEEYVKDSLGGDEAARMKTLQVGGVLTVHSDVYPPPVTEGLPAIGTEQIGSANQETLDARPAIGFATSVFPRPPAATGTPRGGAAAPAVSGAPAAPAAGEVDPSKGILYLHAIPSLHFYDGRLANRPWAQEIPDAVAKAVWGSWVEIHPETAAKLGIENSTMVLLENARGRFEIPALLNSAIHPESVGIEVGRSGHRNAGQYAAEAWGLNPLALVDGAVDPASGALVISPTTVSVKALALKRPVIVLQSTERQNETGVARSTTYKDLTKAPIRDFKEQGRPSLYSTIPPKLHPRTDRKWGMLIDLDRCVGCNACAAACYAENNIPFVGKSDCNRGREMSWLRIETFAGMASSTGQPGDRDPAVTQLDVRYYVSVCMQCDNAPCEYVCPVFATEHNDEGLNMQVYNRCIGTRFCSNNCPYKVRRFNWFTYKFPYPLDQQLNPDVIHRPKGVMEKCSFCIQRIRAHEIQSEAEDRPIRDGEIQTACMQTCPTDAIIFGNQKDPGSVVHQHFHAERRGYGAMEDLNTYPNVQYLKRVRAEPA